MQWVLEQLRKHGLYANLKKCRFHEDEVQFLSFVVSAQGIKMEEEKIEAVRDWPEPKSVRDIQVFLGFANFYRRFIRNFSRIAAPLTSMLRTTNNEALSTQATEKGKIRMYRLVLVVVRLVEVSKICQPLQNRPNPKNQNRLSPKSQIYRRPILQGSIPERIFLLPKPKKPSYTYKRLLPRLRFLIILIQNAISKLRQMLRCILLVGS